MRGTRVKIRTFEPDDAPAVASLWQYWFRGKSRTPAKGLEDLARRLYVENPNTDSEIRPLVAVDEVGKMLGFLGVTVMPVMVDGQIEKLAGLFPSVVDPGAPTTIATFLMRKFLAGPQALTFSDGGHQKFEKIWELLGGSIGQMQSLRWAKVFRVGSVGLAVMRGRQGPARATAAVLSPLVRGGDVVARKLGKAYLTSRGQEGYATEPLTPHSLPVLAREMLGEARLWPIYDEAAVAWQFREMTKIVEQGEFRARLVRHGDATVGWFIYYLKRGGVCRVFDIEATPQHLDAVIGQLFAEAERDGAGAVIGRMEPRLRGPLSRHGTLVYNGGSLLMLHSRDKNLVNDGLLGRLAFSRMQGENWYWWAIKSRTVP